MTKYYVVEVEYCGPNPYDAKHVDFNRYEIMTTPPRNAIGEICWDGQLGTSNNVTRYALGQYDSLAAAEYAIQTGPLLHQQFRRGPLEDFPYNVLAVYRPGRLPPMSDEALGQWLENSVDISADDTDTDLVRQAGALRYELEEEGHYSVTHVRMLSVLKDLRDNARRGIDN
ncbi:hypothetical protein [Thiolapillus sp.]|uniref:hypothetical protein n=1 Tax=Thiolapillus sp. TaxID=2017437 RepID=UPI003AF4AF0C